MPGELVLVVDDEPNIVQLARLYLEREGYRVGAVGNGKDALETVARLRPVLIVLDIMLPGMDGLEVCRRLRADNNPIPIIMLTARDEDVDKIIGLEMGADDYLTKPFNPRELVARVKAMLRRGERLVNEMADRQGATPLYLDDLLIDPARREVSVNGQPVQLRTQEFDLLLALAEHKSFVLTREQLLEKAWGYEFVGQSRTVDVHIGHLRRKISASRVQIETVTGVGYKLVV
jgi:two-component system alkaline phosphatase synthesis response regulator PhoP